MYNPDNYTREARKANRMKRKVSIAITLLFVILAYGYVGNSDYETKQLETLALTK